jgi:UDP:flavonoid glycosyltransferase YjiC (YdhE family)
MVPAVLGQEDVVVRVIFTFFGTRPHLYPLVPLAWAFRAAGHEVRLCGPPKWTADIAATGLPAVSVGGSPRVPASVRDELATAFFSQEPWPTDWAANVARLDRGRLDHLESVGRYLVAAADAMVDDLVSFGRNWRPDAIVYDSFSYAGPVCAAAIDVPGVRHLSGTDSAQRLELRQPGPDPLPEYAALFGRFDTPAGTEPQYTVDPTPPSMRLVSREGTLDMRYVPYNGPGAVPDGLRGQRPRPRMCVTWGHTISTNAGPDAVRSFLLAIEQIAALGMDCLVAAPKPDVERLGTLPDSVTAIASVPLHLVLPYCDGIVHQGGDGTALTAATAAIPQLVIAGSSEADMCGGRIAAAGAGIYLRDPDLRDDPDRPVILRHALQSLLSDPRFADGAAGLRDEIERQPTPAEVARRLATLVSETASVGG